MLVYHLAVKSTLMKVYENTINICGENVNCYKLVAVINRFG